jgi:ribosomal protein S18 acetylase RimI-like enzyme
MEFKIVEAKLNHIEQVGELFDLYRQFYKYESNLIESTNYIKDRIINKESIIFFALNDVNQAMGFVQLYETFGSLDLGKIIILYDLYVKKDHRKNKIGRQLMLISHEYAKKINAKRIQLSTATDNFIGQSLYKSLGYVKDADFYTYDFEIKQD